MKKLLSCVVASVTMLAVEAVTYVQSWRGLPADYTQVEYIESTGTQYIDTGIAPTPTTAVDFMFNLVKYENQKAFFGQGWSGGRYLFNQQNNNFNFHGGGNLSGDLANGTYALVIEGNDYRCQIEPTTSNNGTLTLTWGGVTRSCTVSLSVDNGKQMRIFGSTDSGHFSKIKFYGMKIRKDGVLVADLVPAIDANGKGGLYNLVGEENNWMANAGSGDFTVGNAVPNPVPDFTPMLTATGARRIYRSGAYEIYEWTAIGEGNGFTVPEGGAKADLLLVGGGGAGGMTRGGGGGGGGVIYNTALDLAAGSYAVTVGAGGIPQYVASAYQSKDNNGETYNKGKTPDTANGGNSSVSNGGDFELVAFGGGGGGCFNYNGSGDKGAGDSVGLDGGSGGGAGGHNEIVSSGGAGTTDQGFAGSNNANPVAGGGGGGGAGEIGGSPQSGRGGNGGAGREIDITGTAVCYGGGGGGGYYSNDSNGAGGAGGAGGGGSGNFSTHGPLLAQNGIDGLGGGGGGGGAKSNNGWYGVGGVGGSGTVVLRVLMQGMVGVQFTTDNSKACELGVTAQVTASDDDPSDTFDIYVAVALPSVDPQDYDYVKIGEGVSLNVDSGRVFGGLAADTPYNVAVKAQNRNTGKWSEVTISSTRTSPLAQPVAASGPGIVKTATGYDVSIVVSRIQDDVENLTATLGGVEKEISAVGTYTWQVPASGDGCSAAVSVDYQALGFDFHQELSASVSGEGQVIAVETLAGHDTAATAFVLNVGDKVVLPVLEGNAMYKNLSGHRFLKLDGSTVTALEPGIGAVEEYGSDGSLVGTAAFLVKPDMQDGGRVFVFDNRKNTEKWSDAAWVQPGVEGYVKGPNDPKDVAFVLFTKDGKANFKIDGTNSVQDIYFGRPYNGVADTRLWGPGKLTVHGVKTKKSSRPGKVMICSCDIAGNWWTVYFCAYNASELWTLDVSQNDVELDMGGPTDKFYAVKNTRTNQSVLRIDRYLAIDIPAGRTFSLVNGSDFVGGSGRGDGQIGADAFYYLTAGKVVQGGGVFALPISGVVNYGGNFFTNFTGEIVASVRNFVSGYTGRDGAAFVSESGNFYGDAKLTLAGYVNGFSVTKSVGTFSHGANHGWGAPDSQTGNGIPYAGVKLNGGYLKLQNYSKTITGFKPTTFAGVADYEALSETSKLTIGGGLSEIDLNVNPPANNPIIHLHAEELVHEDSGSLFIYDARTWKGNTSLREIAELDGLSAHFVGNTTEVDEPNDVFPIVPWMVARYQYDYDTSDLWWAHTGSDNVMCRGGVRTNKKLTEVDSPLRNVYCSGYGVALTDDVTVNSLVLEGQGKEKKLGEGRTLTITSGGLVIKNSDNGFGQAGNSANGSVVFPNRAYVWACSSDASWPDVIWSPITAPNGFCAAGIGQLRIGGDQTGIDGDITVNNGTLQLGDTAGHGCLIDVPINLVGGNTKLQVNQAGTLKLLTLNLSCPGGYGPKITVPAAGEKCTALNVDGVSMPRGVYGAIGSGAEFESEHIADGSGFLTVRTDDYQSGFMIYLR